MEMLVVRAAVVEEERHWCVAGHEVSDVVEADALATSERLLVVLRH